MLSARSWTACRLASAAPAPSHPCPCRTTADRRPSSARIGCTSEIDHGLARASAAAVIRNVRTVADLRGSRRSAVPQARPRVRERLAEGPPAEVAARQALEGPLAKVTTPSPPRRRRESPAIAEAAPARPRPSDPAPFPQGNARMTGLDEIVVGDAQTLQHVRSFGGNPARTTPAGPMTFAPSLTGTA